MNAPVGRCGWRDRRRASQAPASSPRQHAARRPRTLTQVAEVADDFRREKRSGRPVGSAGHSPVSRGRQADEQPSCDRGRLTGGRPRERPGQGGGGRAAAGLGHRVARGARSPRRGRPVVGPRRRPRRGPDVRARRGPRPLDGGRGGRPAGRVDLPRHGVGRPLGLLARSRRGQGPRRPGARPGGPRGRCRAALPRRRRAHRHPHRYGRRRPAARRPHTAGRRHPLRRRRRPACRPHHGRRTGGPVRAGPRRHGGRAAARSAHPGARTPGAGRAAPRAVRQLVRVLPPLHRGPGPRRRPRARHLPYRRAGTAAHRAHGLRHRLPAADPPDR